MEHLRPLFDRYDRILIFDTETTGLDFVRDEIIQFSAVAVGCPQGRVAVTEEYDRLLLLAPGKQVPPEITRLTGITTEEIAQRGIPREQACEEIAGLLSGNTLLTVYRDRRDYPHRLCNAIEAYNLQDRVHNSHRADQDALATAYVMGAMMAEREDLLNYVNLFGYIPKFGPPRRPIRSVTYRPQPYHNPTPLYE